MVSIPIGKLLLHLRTDGVYPRLDAASSALDNCVVCPESSRLPVHGGPDDCTLVGRCSTSPGLEKYETTCSCIISLGGSCAGRATSQSSSTYPCTPPWSWLPSGCHSCRSMAQLRGFGDLFSNADLGEFLRPDALPQSSSPSTKGSNALPTNRPYGLLAAMPEPPRPGLASIISELPLLRCALPVSCRHVLVGVASLVLRMNPVQRCNPSSR